MLFADGTAIISICIFNSSVFLNLFVFISLYLCYVEPIYQGKCFRVYFLYDIYGHFDASTTYRYFAQIYTTFSVRKFML